MRRRITLKLFTQPLLTPPSIATSNMAIRHYLSHGAFINRMTRLGYPPEKGFCHGLSCVAAQYFLSQNMPAFDRQLHYFANYIYHANPKPNDTIRFLDDVALAQSPQQFPVFKKNGTPHFYNPWQNVTTALSLIENKAILKQGGIQSTAFSNSIYSMTELTRYFRILRQALQDFPYPCALLTSSVAHMIMLAFNHSKKQWLLMDINNLPVHYYSHDEDTAKAVTQALSLKRKSQNVVFHVDFAIARQHHTHAKKFFLQMKSNKDWTNLHAITPKKANQYGGDGSTWLMKACQNRQKAEAASLIKLTTNIDALNKLNATALFYAIENTQADIVRLLLTAGAKATDDNNTYLQIAAAMGLFEIAKMLIQYGAPVCKGSPSPLFFALQNKDQKMVNLLTAQGNLNAGRSFGNRFDLF